MVSASTSTNCSPAGSPSSLKDLQQKPTDPMAVRFKSWVAALGAAFAHVVVNYLVRRVRFIADLVTPSVIIALVLFAGGFTAVLAAFAYGVVTQYLETLARLGAVGQLLVVLTFIPVSLPFVVGYTPLTLATGYMYGVFNGFATSFVGAMLGAVVAFLGTRLLYRERLRAILERDARIRSFMYAVERHGFTAVVGMRFVPIPFGVQNGLFAVTGVSFFKFTCASIVGLPPALLAGNYAGASLGGLSDVYSGRAQQSEYHAYMIYTQLLVAAVVVAFMVHLSRRAMRFVALDDHLEAHRAENAAHSQSVVRASVPELAHYAPTSTGAKASGAPSALVSSGLLAVPLAESASLYKLTPEKLRHSMPSIAHETAAMLPSSMTSLRADTAMPHRREVHAPV